MTSRPKPAEQAPEQLISELKSYIGFSDADVTRLREFSPNFEARRPEFSERFYEFILKNERVAEVIKGGGYSLTGLRSKWENWASELFTGSYDGEYASRRLSIGAVHLHIGVDERYTVAAFHLVREFMIELTCEVYLHETERCLTMISSVNRILDLDLSLISHAYDLELEAETVAEQSRKRRSIEDLLRLLLEAPSLLVLSVDSEGSIVHFNRGCEVLFGQPRESVVDKNYVETLVVPADQERATAEIAQLIDRKTSRASSRRLAPQRLCAADGGECVVTWYPAAVPAGAEGRAEFLWVGHDTTEEQRLQGQLIHQEKMAAVGLLAAGVAHEIGNPLASISSVVQTVLRKTDDEYVHGKLDLVRTHIDRIANIVHRMVDFARPPRYEWRPCSINELVKNAAHILEYDKRARHVAIALDLSTELPETVAMEDQLTQVFLNIILNALDAMEGNPEDRPPRLAIESRLEGSTKGHPFILFRCQDNGPGISTEEARRIFEPFFTTKEVGRGTGLGLSVSFRIIDEHGGRISIEPSPGGGACFEVRIPVRQTPPEEAT